MCVPSALDHFVTVFSHHGQRQLFGQVTLEVGDHDLCVIGTSEQVVRSGGKPNGPNVTGVRPVHLDDASSSDVIQHACAIFLSCC